MTQLLPMVEFQTGVPVLVNLTHVETVEPDGLSHVTVTMRSGRKWHFDGSLQMVREQIAVMGD